MEFPQYRKYKNDKSYFRILSNQEFEEYQLQFGELKKHVFKVKILPERNFLDDMLNNYHSHWDRITKAEFDLFIGDN